VASSPFPLNHRFEINEFQKAVEVNPFKILTTMVESRKSTNS